MEIEAMRYVTMDEINEMMTALTSQDLNTAKEYMLKYCAMDPAKQCALGYMEELLSASLFGYRSPYQAAARIFYFCREKRELKSPISFHGWAGKHSDLGPLYLIRREAFQTDEVELFYSDDFIQSNQKEAEFLAEQIAKESSGISNVRAEWIGNFQIDQDETEERWAVVFQLDQAAVKDAVYANSNLVTSETTGGFVFVLPKTGEFNCILGHRHEGGCFILSKDMFCMK